MRGASTFSKTVTLLLALLAAAGCSERSGITVFSTDPAGCVVRTSSRSKDLLGTSIGHGRHHVRCDEQVELGPNQTLLCRCVGPADGGEGTAEPDGGAAR